MYEVGLGPSRIMDHVKATDGPYQDITRSAGLVNWGVRLAASIFYA